MEKHFADLQEETAPSAKKNNFLVNGSQKQVPYYKLLLVLKEI